MTVDVREVVRNLYSETLYNNATDILRLSDNAYLSSNIVHLLKRAIYETYSETYDEELIELRMRAVSLLGLSRNPEATPIVTDRLHNDPSWRVRDLAAKFLGELAGEAAIPPPIEILSQSDSNMESLRHEAAEALAQYAMLYGFILKYRGKTFAEGVPATPREHRIVTESDRTRIRQALELAGYDIYELTRTYPGFEPITDPEFEISAFGITPLE